MKTAISIPDEIFEAAEALAEELGVTRSRLYTEAVSSFVARHRDDEVTRKLNEIYASTESSLDATLEQMQLESLPREDW